ncbi:MAG: SoxR reducing system RseC family protein [Candidatus Eisenbacteria sp.]|nr:SoxR reducing system RseC family protein [Candidatus Eisenbacteria bacterium]
METCGTARVVRAFGSRAEVVVERANACGHCHAADLCEAFSGRGVLRLEVDNPAGAREGQLVEIAAARSLGLRAAFMVYMLPALFFVAGVIAGSEVLRWPPWGSALLGFGMLAVSWFVARRYDRSASRRKEFRLMISRVLRESETTAADIE